MYFVYAIKTRDQHAYIKIGVAQNPLNRLNELQTGCPVRLELVHACPVLSKMHAYSLEGKLHDELAKFKINRGGTEWFLSDCLWFIKKHEKKRILLGENFENTKPGCSGFFSKRLKGTPGDVTTQLKAFLGDK